jgi:hypothetical protein
MTSSPNRQRKSMHAASLHQVTAMPGRLGQIFIPVILVWWMLIILPDTFDDERMRHCLCLEIFQVPSGSFLEMVLMSSQLKGRFLIQALNTKD